MATLVGRTVGKYRVVAKLGRGGMAEVYKAYQPGLDRYVSIKVLHAHLVDDKDFIGRFEREALAIGKLRHPNIVHALDFDREGETYFMSMEYIDGPTLKDELKARKAKDQIFTLPEISRIFTALCSAIDYAHARGMVHRDVKPANVMINDEGQIVLTDFGIARIMGSTQYTQTGALSGTPAYMSPEQGQGERGDERSDIYSLGVMLYEMVTGMVPYDADTPFAVIMKHISEPLPLPTQINPDLPESVERVVLRSMSKQPDDRYQTAGEMAIDLRNVIGVSLDDDLRKSPLITVASAPDVDEIEHPTGPITAMERTVSSSSAAQGATAWGGNAAATTVGTLPAKGSLLMPILIGGGIVVIVMLMGIIGFLALSDSDSGDESTPDIGATEITVAIAAVTEDAEHAQETATAEAQAATTAAAAEASAPTETAQAATAEAERIAATEIAQATRDAGLVGGILATAQAATAEVATAEAIVAETATAEWIAGFTATPIPTDTPPPTNIPPPPTNTPAPLIPTDTPTPEFLPIAGKLAFPVDNGTGNYNVIIASLPDGKIIKEIVGARQPHFKDDGTKLLINGQGGSFGENIFQASGTGDIERAVSGSPSDLFPLYKFDGTTIAYSNPQLAVGSQGYQSYLFVQCSARPPIEENDPQCTAIADFEVIVPSGNLGDVIGSHPVWTTGDRLVYKGCDTWKGGGSCGLYSVGSWATKRLGGETPQKIIDGTSVHPTDARAGLVTYMSRETGDWEVFIMGENGGGATNISNSSTSNDGVGTISPDGKWVAFASDRAGAWAIFAVSRNGGEVQKLLDFPKSNPWGTGDREWTNERMSWAP